MIITTEENKTLITCKYYNSEMALEFDEDADADEMIVQIRRLLSFMMLDVNTIDYIMGVEK